MKHLQHVIAAVLMGLSVAGCGGQPDVPEFEPATGESSWQYDCAADFVNGQAWQWLFNSDNSVHDLAGHKLGNFYWQYEGYVDNNLSLSINAYPGISETYWPGGRLEGSDIVFNDRSGNETGRCTPTGESLPAPAYIANGSELNTLFECDYQAELSYLVFHTDGAVTSQYGVAQETGRYKQLSTEQIQFNGIGWAIEKDEFFPDTIHLIGENHHPQSDTGVRETCIMISENNIFAVQAR